MQKMKSYAKPVVLANDEVAEGVYAGSGKKPECWTIEANSVQDLGGSEHVFEIKCVHSDTVKHISAATTIELVFSAPLINARSEFKCDWSGQKVTVTRDLLADAYHSGDTMTFKVWVQAADDMTTRGITCKSATIKCTHETNVQGEYD